MSIRFTITRGVCLSAAISLGASCGSVAPSADEMGSTSQAEDSALAGSSTGGPVDVAGSNGTASTTSTSDAPSTGAKGETGPVGDPDCGGVVHVGDLEIQDGVDLSYTTAITQVLGTVTMRGTTELSDASALASLQCADGLVLAENQSLVSLSGLQDLHRVNRNFALWRNPLLGDASGVSGLNQIGSVEVGHNPALLELPRFSAGLELGGQSSGVSIGDGGYTDLSSLEDWDVQSVHGRLTIRVLASSTLESTSGLGILADRATNEVNVLIANSEREAGSLRELDLSGFDELDELTIEGNLSALEIISAPDLRTVGELTITATVGVPDFSGFSALEAVSRRMLIGCQVLASGPTFASLAGLESLVSAPVFVVANGPLLTTLGDLPSTVGSERLVIAANPQLPGVEVDAFVAAAASQDVINCGNAGQSECRRVYDCFASD